MLREPLLHFIVLGAAIFAVSSLLNRDLPGDDEILVSQAQQDRLVAGFTRTWNRPPTQREYESVLEDWIREEIAYRQGLRMGLDSDDAIIRRRLRQKVELLAEELVTLAPPTEEELETYLAANLDNYRGEERFTLRQVTFSVDERGDSATIDAEQALLLLSGAEEAVNPATLGDATPLPALMEQTTPRVIATRFGREFASKVRKLEPGRWHGPIRSGFGVHLVRIDDYAAAEAPTLAAVERDLRRDLGKERREAALDSMYAELARQYTITVEGLEDGGDS